MTLGGNLPWNLGPVWGWGSKEWSVIGTRWLGFIDKRLHFTNTVT